MLVSICIPCYNASKYLADTLKALINQSYEELEITVVDDHSTDDSLQIIQKYALLDKRIKYNIAKKKGASAARNQAYHSSNGEYIIFFDADDLVPENFIETQLNRLRSNREVVVAKWGRFYANDLTTIRVAPNQVENDLTFEEWIIAYWYNVSHMTCPGRVLIPNNLIIQSGLWDEDLSLNDDFTFYTRIFSNCDIIRYNASSLFYYRSGIRGLSSIKGDLALQSLYRSLTRSITTAKFKLKDSALLNKCYANLLQQFIYETYPNQPQMIKESKRTIKTYGGSDLNFPSGGKTKLINHFFGWKLVKRIKIRLGKFWL